ncbi:hypothetical protein AB0F46_01780 [Streptomyces sp. NPDC026665]|uniref:hypothetical protein n=1 Tax=Streptomyces sp. NPDC026665 TaxID=3154798 RepID=UPI0033C22144
MNQPAPEHVAWIGSTIHPETRKAACLLRWGTIEALITPEDAHTTARELMAAAAFAETDVALFAWCRNTLKVDLVTAGQMVRDIRGNRPAPPGRSALRIEAVVGFKTGEPYVHIARGSVKGQINPDEARQMAAHWTDAALAAHIDVRLRYALGEQPGITPGDIEQILERVQGLQR